MARTGIGWVLALVGMGLGIVVGCGDDSSRPEEGSGTLLLSRVSVAVVPGGSDRLVVLPWEGSGTQGDFTAQSSNEGIATVAVEDSLVTVTGVAFGECEITIRGASGASRAIPVEVYDHRVIDTGELLVTFTDQFAGISDWNAGPGCGLYRPVPPAGFHELGTFLVSPQSNPNGQRAALVVKAKPGTGAIAFTHDFELVLNYSSRDFWRPIAPAGYRALGVVATYLSTPDSAACIRADLTVAGEASTPLYQFNAYSTWFSWWGIDQPDAGPHASAYVAPGTFLYAAGVTGPTFDPALYVLKLDLPMLGEAEPQTFLPKLTGYTSPPSETPPLFAKAMLVPCTTTRDAFYAGNQPWRIANSPFYRLERHVYYKLLYHNYNQTSEVQTNSVVIHSGVETTASQTFSNNTGVAISAEAGVELSVFSAKVTTTVSLEFGYESQTSVTELQEKEVSTSINTAPGKAAALWQEFNRYVLYRHNGTALEPVSAWEFGIDSYITDEYPD